MATIDERVVEMRFNNSQFEQGTKESMKSIDELEKKLQFKDAGAGLTALGSATQQVAAKFDAMSVMAITAISRMTNSAIDAGERMVKSLTVDQVTAGWQKYADKTSAVQTIMAATAKQFDDTGVQMEFVNEQLDKLNWFTDETSYNFVDMVSNIGKFTSNNIDLETSVTAMQGIAAWAAKSGANANEASRAMYNLSQAIAVGSVKLIDWKSIENANMATAEFKETAIETAVALGTLKRNADGTFSTLKGNTVTVSNFNEALSDTWFSSEVLLKTLGKYGEFADELHKTVEETGISTSELIMYINQYRDGTLNLEQAAVDSEVSVETLSAALEKLGDDSMQFGMKAFVAAQEAKTFKDVIDATADAVSSGWMQTFELIFGNYLQAKEMWTNLSLVLYDIFASSAEYRNEMLKAWNDLGGREVMLYGIAEAFRAIKSTLKPLRDGIREIFPKDDAKDAGARLFELTKRFAEFFDGLRLSERRASQYQRIFRGLASALDIVLTVIKQIVSAFGGPLLRVFGVGIDVILELLATFGDLIFVLRNLVQQVNVVQIAANLIVLAIQNIYKALNMLWSASLVQDFVAGIVEAFQVLVEAAKPAIDGVVSAVQKFINRIMSMQKLDLRELYSAFTELVSNVFKALTSIELDFSGAMEKIGRAFDWVKTEVRALVNWITNNAGEIRFDKLFGIVYAAAVVAALLGIRKAFNALGETLEKFGDIAESISGVIDAVKGVLKGWQNELNSRALLNVAKAVAILAASIGILSFLDITKLAQAAVVLVLLSAAITGLSKVMGSVSMTKFSMSFIALGVGLAAMSASLLMLISALTKLDEINTDNLGKKMIALGALAGIITVAAIAISKAAPKLSSGSIFLISFATSMKLLVGALKDISEAEINLSTKTVGSLIVMMGLLALLVKACSTTSKVVNSAGVRSKTKSGIDAFGLLAVVTSLHILISALKRLGDMELGDIRNGLTAMVPIMGMFAALMIASKAAGQYADKAGKAMLSVSVAMILIGVAIKALAKIDAVDLRKGVSNISEILGMFALITLVSKFAGANAAKAGVAILAMSAAIALLVAPIMVLSGIDDSELDRATEAIVKIRLMFSVLVAATHFAKDAAGSIKAMGISLTLLVAAMAVLAVIDPEGMERATKAIDSLIVCLALLAASTKLVNSAGKVIPALVTMTAVVAAITAMMVHLANVPSDGMLEKSTAISEILAVMAGAIALIGVAKASLSKQAMVSLTVMTLIVGVIGGIIAALSLLDMSQAITIATSLSEVLLAMSTALLIFSRATAIPINVANATQLAAAFGIVALIITAMTAVAGLIAEQEGALRMLESGVELLGTVGEAIGRFLGGIVGGAIGGLVKGTTDILPALGTNLSSFMQNMTGFFEGARGIDNAAMEGVANLGKAVLAITAAQVLDGLTRFITGGSALSKFGDELASFGPSFRTFANEMGQINNTDTLVTATEAAKVVAEFAHSVPNSGGLLGALVGDNLLSEFGNELAAFAPGFAAYAKKIQEANIDTDIITATSAAAKSITEFANNVPNSGGALAYLMGDNLLSEFGNQLKKFAPGFVAYAEKIQEANIDEDLIKSTTIVIKSIVAMANDIPNSGGKLAEFFGDNDIGQFGSSLEEFGESFARYSSKMGEVSVESISKTTPVMGALIELANTIPETGGIFDVFGGTADIAAFGNKLVTFGNGIKSYSDSISNISVAQMQAVNIQLRGIIELIKELESVDQKKMGQLPLILKQIANDATSYFVQTIDDAKTQAADAGANLVKGVEVGVDRQAPSLRAKAKSAAEGYLAAFRRAAGIHSPSEEGKKDGENLVKGAEVGVEQEGKNFFQKAKDTANGYISNFRESIGTLNNSYSTSTFGDGVKSILGFEKGAESESGGLSALVEKLGNSITDPIKSITESMTGQGSSMVDNIAKGISSNTKAEAAAKSKAESITNAFEEALSKYSLNMTTSDLEYKLWSAENEKTATEADKLNAEIVNISQKMTNQAEIVSIAQEKYKQTLASYGETAKETQEAYNSFLQEQTSLFELQNSLSTAQENSAQAAATALATQKNAQKQFNSFMTQNAGKLLQQGFGMDEIKKFAAKATGYEIPEAMKKNQNGIESQIIESTKSIKNTWSQQANSTSELVVSEYTDIGMQSVTSMGNAITQNSNVPVDGTKSVGTQCASVLKNQVPVWNTGGKNMAKSLADGITENSSVIVQAAKSAASNAFTQAMASLNKSTGTTGALAAAKSAGANISKAVAGGTLGEAYAIFDATGEISEVLLQEALNYAVSINEAVSNQLDSFTPSIRPVIDMTDVEGSIKKIDEYIAKATTASQALGSGRISQDINTRGYLGIKTRRNDDTAGLMDTGYSSTTVVNFTQNNSSPKALSEAEIYRQTSNVVSTLTSAVSSVISAASNAASKSSSSSTSSSSSSSSRTSQDIRSDGSIGVKR